MSRYGNATLHPPRLHLASLVDDFRAHGAQTAVVAHRGVRSERTTYGELARLAGRFAAELHRRGIRPGERVLLWGDNSAHWIAVFFGAVLRGVLIVPLDAAGSPDFARRVMAEVAPRLIVASAARLRQLPTGIPSLDLENLGSLLPAEPDYTVDPAVQPDTAFQIVFTSGTTSAPKGIVHTHRNVLSSLTPIETEAAKYRRYVRLVHPLRFLHTLPLSHVFGQFMGLWIPSILAAELHFTDALDAGRIVALLRAQRISVLIAVPRVLALLRSFLLGDYPALELAIDRASALPAWKRWWRFRAVHRRFGWKFWAVISGGASLPAELEQFWNRLGFALIQGYGLTETAALVTLNHPFHIGRGTIGKALPGREVRLSDTGELLVRGPMVAATTWQDGGFLPRESEWLATGDLAEQNEAGEFRFLGRKGDAIVTASGLNIHPADLEAAMLQQPGIRACAVVPCDLPTGPEPVCVVLTEAGSAALSAAVEAANRQLAGFQQMRRVLRWPQLTFPYTSTGKLLRREIRAWACATLAEAHSTGARNLASVEGVASQDTAGSVPPDATGDLLLQSIAAVTGEPVPSPAHDALRLSEDLHLDSLARVQLASALEQRTGILLGDDTVAALATLGDLRRAVAAGLAPSVFARISEPALAESIASATPPPNPGSVRATPAPKPVRATPATYPHWPWSAPVRLVRTLFLEVAVRPLLALLLAPRVTRTGTIPPGPVLLVANHLSLLDAPLVLYALRAPLRRNVAIMMSGEMLAEFRSGQRAGVFGRAAYWLLTALFNVFPLPRLQGFRESFAHAGEALDRGMSVLLFPEGARSKTGSMAPFRSGVGLLAQQAGVPLVPVALLGLYGIRNTRWFRSGAVEVRIGEPIPWQQDRAPEVWTAELEERLRALL